MGNIIIKSNGSLIKKVNEVMTTAGLSTGGLLPTEKSDKFISNIFGLSRLSEKVTTFSFESKDKKLSMLDLDSRIVYPKTEGLRTGRYAGYATSDVTLTPKPWKVVLKMSYESLEQNIERGNFQRTLLDSVSKRIGENLEQFALNGDILGPSIASTTYDPRNGEDGYRVLDAFHALVNGWLRQADDQVHDALYDNNMAEIFNDMINALPESAKVNEEYLRFFVPSKLKRQFIAQLATRNTVLGDQMMTGAVKTTYGGLEIIHLPLFDTNPVKVQHLTLTGTTAAALRYTHTDKDYVYITSTDITDSIAEVPYIDTTDYVVTEATGEIARSGSSSAIPTGATVKVTYKSPGEAILCDPKNLLIGINKNDMRIQYDKDIEADNVIMAVSGTFDVKMLRPEQVVKGINIKYQTSLS